MEKLCLFLFLAILSQEAFGMSYRFKRQGQDDSSEGDLEDRYGWSWGSPGRLPRPPAPWRPNPNMFPNPNPNPRPIPRPTPFPNPSPNRPTPGQDQPTTSSTASPNVNGGNPANLQTCRRSCITTSEYNPVCGTNNVSYDNPSRLYCDQGCGVNVSILRTAKCPTANPTPTA